MRTIKFTKIRILAILLICAVCASAVLIPYFNHAESDDGDYKATWVSYATSGHLTITADSTDYTKESLVFTGYSRGNPFECALTNPGNDIQNEFINFTVDRTLQNPHSCSGAGFLVNVNPATGAGYFVAMYRDKLFLIRSDDQFKANQINTAMVVGGLTSGEIRTENRQCPICKEYYGFYTFYNMAGPYSDSGSPYQLPEYGSLKSATAHHTKYCCYKHSSIYRIIFVVNIARQQSR